MSQVLAEIQTQAVSEAVSERILELISSGALKAGDALPPQRQLASQLGVSLSSLREALQALTAVGIVEIKHGRGTFVCTHPTDAVIKHLDWAMRLGSEETRELMEARRVIDASVSGYAAARATDSQIRQIYQLYCGMVESWQSRDIGRLDELDVQFHLAIAEASGNALLFHLAQSLYAFAARFVQVVPHTRAGMENHRLVYVAIAAHDAPAAEAAVLNLLDDTEGLYQQGRKS
jgi:DNA-binding FadR family transcriptional regulator